MNYQEALGYIHGTEKFGSKIGLERITYLLNLMGNPHKHLKVIHVAGTNGKGSTAVFIASVLEEQGYKVGLYTSPYLQEFTERICVNRENISKKILAEITIFVKKKVEEMVKAGMEHPTEFEIVTAIGFEYFNRQKVDMVVLEVGLGGRADATNVIDSPLVSVITPIALDHMDYLGDTIEKIAYEKAGIIKQNCLVVSYPQQPEAMKVIEEICSQKNCQLVKAPVDKVQIVYQTDTEQCFDILYKKYSLKNVCISMVGQYQIENAIVAITTLKLLEQLENIKLDQEKLYRGLKRAFWPGRLEILQTNPIVLIDGAHNPHGMRALTKVLKERFSNKKIILGLGILKDKNAVEMIDEIVPHVEKIILTQPNHPKKMSLEKLEAFVKKYKKICFQEPHIEKAVKVALALSNKEDVVVFTGSLYMIGEIRKLFKLEKMKINEKRGEIQ